jgi:uncharacterized small protein (DUF1192 family)
MKSPATNPAPARVGKRAKGPAAEPVNSDDLKVAQSRLQNYLKQLEQEQVRLTAELAKKKARREAAGAGESPAAANQERLERIESRLRRSEDLAARQARFMRKLRAVYARNERLLDMIAQRLDEIEAGAPPESGGETLKDELMQMLIELNQMRERREELARRVQAD